MKAKHTALSDGRDADMAMPAAAHTDSTSAATRSGFDLDVATNGTPNAGWSSTSIVKWDQLKSVDRRSDKIRSWRRRALSKRGARLHVTMASNPQPSSLAMLDETGIVVCWYGSWDGRDYAAEEVVDRHLSLFYVSEEVARRQPHRDLRAAVIEGHITRQAWRRRSDGSSFWGTYDIRPVVLRDGRVQGFSYIASAPDQTRHSDR
ncbi:hypothetical protein [Steroidobacter sp.]|uniref:hypothetical protein n=1 Tax=Steroidobacter sp. TaxID=1978227 RepID=UPI001A54709C|nr:hypothetical protein [Steroidobacter sp.]MBL8266378.1 hypothetical protein [Steroidobacter sp.]